MLRGTTKFSDNAAMNSNAQKGSCENYEGSLVSNSQISQWSQQEMEFSVLTQSSPTTTMQNWDSLDLFSQVPEPPVFATDDFQFFQSPLLSPTPHPAAIPGNDIFQSGGICAGPKTNAEVHHVGLAVNGSIEDMLSSQQYKHYVDNNDSPLLEQLLNNVGKLDSLDAKPCADSTYDGIFTAVRSFNFFWNNRSFDMDA